MTFSEHCIRRPVLTTLLTASLVLVGLFTYRLLPVSALPRVDFPTIQVTASLPGASPETIAATVTTPIEQQLSAVSGVTSMVSTSSPGGMDTILTFDLTRNLDAAALDVQNALSAARSNLPAEMTTAPRFLKVNPAERPVLWIALSSATVPLSTVNDYAETILQRQLSQIRGVAQVGVYGSQKFAVRIQVDPEAAAARGISLDELRSAIVKANSSAPVGTLVGPRENIALDANGQLERAEDYRNLVVAWRSGAPVRLGEVARLVDSVENNKLALWVNDKPMILVSIKRQADANTIEIVDAVRNMLPSLRAQIPASITMDPQFDRSGPIREAMLEVYETLAIAIALVVLVMFLFLRSGYSTLIPSIVVPVSLIATCTAMYMMGFSLNNITLLALTLSVGFVVDDAIVMLENIMRHVEGGMRPFEAAITGAREIGFTVISITVSLVAVFIPVLFMGGIVGRIFREFAVTVSVAIVISGIVALTMIPMLCARILRDPRGGRKPNPVLIVFERWFQSWQKAYASTLGWAIRFRSAMLLVTLATIGGTVWLFIAIPKSFLPEEDTDYAWQETEGPASASFRFMATRQQEVAKIVRADKAVEQVNTYVGEEVTANWAYLDIKLKPKKERDPASVVFERLKKQLGELPGIRVDFGSAQSVQIGGTTNKYQYTLRSSNTEALFRTVPQMRSRLSKLEGLSDVSSDLQFIPQLKISIDREKAAVYGITMDQIRQELLNAYGSRQISTIYTSANGYQVIMEVLPELQTDPTQLPKLKIKTGGGQAVPIDAVARLEPGVAPLQIRHFGQRPAVNITFKLKDGYSLDRAIESIKNAERQLPLPPNVSGSFRGTAGVFQESLAGQWILILAAIFVTYVVLGILYESFIHPITIISGLPSAAIGALITLMAFKMDLTIIAMIGMLMLIGIVKKNAIMIVDFAIERRRAGLSAEAAIHEACLLRFRPMMMTTFAAVFGTLPIALGTGAGAELRQPLGIVVLGGLMLSQILTLYITPVVYLHLDRFDRQLKRQYDPQLTVVRTDPERIHAIAAE